MSALLFVALLGAASSLPSLELKGVTPGLTTEAEADSWPFGESPHINTIACLPEDSKLPGYAVCPISNWFTLGGKDTKIAVAHLLDGVFAMVHFVVASDDATDIAAGLEKKFGPAAVENLEAQNGFGANYSGVRYTWKRRGVTLVVETLGTKVSEGRVYIQSDELVSVIAKKRGASAELDDL